jgi:hypothetical protein
MTVSEGRLDTFAHGSGLDETPAGHPCRVCLFRELPEGRERAWAVHGARSAVHRCGDAERFGDLRLGGAGADGATSMRGDAAVALLADRDASAISSFVFWSSAPGGVCGGVHPAVSVIDVGDRATRRAGRFAERWAPGTSRGLSGGLCRWGRSAAAAVTASIGHGGQ